MEQPYPFRFYGADPFEWEGELCSYEVHFRSPPDEAERIAVARAFENALIDTSVDARGNEVRWAAAWGLFRVEPKRLGPDFDWGMFFEDIRHAFEAVNRATPIEEIVFLELIDRSEAGEDSGRAWHVWSVDRQAIPGDAPTWGAKLPWLDSLFSARQRRSSVESSVSSSAEAARREVWEAVARAARSTKDAAVSASRIVFARTTSDPPLPAHLESRHLWRRAGLGFCETRAPAGSWLYALRAAEPKGGTTSKKSSKKAPKATANESGAPWELFLGDDKQLHRFEPSLLARDFRWAYGTNSLFVWDGSAIHRADLATRHVVRWASFDTRVLAMAVLAGGLAVLTEKELVVLDLETPAREPARLPTAGKGGIDAVLGGRILILHASAVWGDQTILLAYDAGTFRLIGASHERLELVWEFEGAVFARCDDERGYVELLDLDAAARAAIAAATESALDLTASDAVYSSGPTAIELVEAE